MLKKLGRFFFEGLAAVLPLAVTVYALWWLGAKAEGVFDSPIKWLLGVEGASDKRYIPGMGVAAGFVLLFVVGVLMRLWITRAILGLGESILEKIPLAKTIYGSVKDLMSMFKGKKKSFSTVAFVTMPGIPHKVLGLVTREDFSDMPQVGSELVAVYVPMSYQIGGFTFMVPRDNLEPVDMSAEDAMRFAMTAGVSSDKPAGESAGVEGK
jgi:uncharacterized membrane protein